jgi:hypothetical protein
MIESLTAGAIAALLAVLVFLAFLGILLWLATGKKHKPVRVDFIIAVQQKGKMSSVKITTAQQVVLTAVFKDSDGVVTPLPDGNSPSWSLDDGSVATIVGPTDQPTVTISSIAPGTVHVTVTAEGDPTPGADTITGEFDVEVIADEATQVEITAGTPTRKTPPPATGG